MDDSEGCWNYSVYDGTCVERESSNLFYEEKQLLRSMVDQALSDLGVAELKKDAYNWIMDARSEGAFSFNFACAFLGLDSDCIREGIRKILDSGVKIKRSRRRTKRVKKRGVISHPSKTHST